MSTSTQRRQKKYFTRVENNSKAQLKLKHLRIQHTVINIRQAIAATWQLVDFGMIEGITWGFGPTADDSCKVWTLHVRTSMSREHVEFLLRTRSKTWNKHDVKSIHLDNVHPPCSSWEARGLAGIVQILKVEGGSHLLLYIYMYIMHASLLITRSFLLLVAMASNLLAMAST